MTIDKNIIQTEEFFESIINTVREPVVVLDQHLKVIFVNRSFYEFFKVSPEETVGQLIYDLGNKQWNIPRLRELLETILPEKTAFDNYEVEHDFVTIGRRTMLLNARQIEQAWGKERIILLAIEDITEQKRSQDKIKASLTEKETLLKEVHHRVKNNMQVISSLLRMQARKIKDKNLAEILMDSQNRIKSMALVYNKLYQSENLAQINMADYIKDLITGLIKSYSVKSQRIISRVEQSSVLLGVDIAIPCGIIINELITNSIKYAFPENRSGELAVSIRESGNNDLELLVSDNGVGLPDSFNLRENTKTLGLKLVINLVENQLDGKIELDRSQGTSFKIIFRQTMEEK